MRRLIGCLALAGAAVTPLAAHDFWIEPSTYHPDPGAVVGLRLRVGERFEGETLARDPAHIERFFVAGATGEREVAGRAGRDPAGRFRTGAPGFEVIGYRSRATLIELDTETFDDYLRAEGLDAALSARAGREAAGGPVREIFSRSAKSLLKVGQGDGADDFDRRLGLRLELVPGSDPSAPADDEPLPFVLLHEGVPLAGAQVVAIPAADRAAPRSCRTDRHGRARLLLDRPGAWLVKVVHMVPAPATSGADWESLWASLTFERGATRP